jgi:hypothetical protein
MSSRRPIGGASVCDNLPHGDASRALAARACDVQAFDVPSRKCFAFQFGPSVAVRVVAMLVSLAACADDPAPVGSDAGSDRGSSGSSGAGGSAGTAGDAGGDAIAMPADGADAADEVAPCVVDPDASVTCPPQDLPPDDDCPDAAPSYTTEVAAIIARKCTVCHRAGGLEPANQFDTWAKIKKNNNNIHMLTQVYSCKMPQACGEPLTPGEKQTMLQWLVCGAPNN